MTMPARFLLLLSLLLSATATQADADKYRGEDRGKPLQPAKLNATWQQECGACHLAFAPGLLPAESWRQVMARLDKHFGTDASLSAQENREITAFLVKHASNRWRAPTAPLAISETVWFRRKHDEIAPAVWQRAAVKSPANCAACHPAADKGDFEEDRVRIPR
jgi:hypothetical protein